MTLSGYSNAFVDVMLGWLKGFANWVLRLFNLAGSVSASPLLWLSQNWLKLLIFFLVLGVVLDRLVWLIRWRPYWVWFRKERIIVNDDKFFARAELDPDAEWNEDLEDKWDERDYVVASTVVKRQEEAKARAESARAEGKPRRRRTDARVRRAPADDRRRKANPAQRTESAGRNASSGKGSTRVRRHDEREKPVDDIFGSELKRGEVTDSYEDEVFNVSNLPVSDEFNGEDRRA